MVTSQKFKHYWHDQDIFVQLAYSTPEAQLIFVQLAFTLGLCEIIYVQSSKYVQPYLL